MAEINVYSNSLTASAGSVVINSVDVIKPGESGTMSGHWRVKFTVSGTKSSDWNNLKMYARGSSYVEIEEKQGTGYSVFNFAGAGGLINDLNTGTKTNFSNEVIYFDVPTSVFTETDSTVKFRFYAVFNDMSEDDYVAEITDFPTKLLGTVPDTDGPHAADFTYPSDQNPTHSDLYHTTSAVRAYVHDFRSVPTGFYGMAPLGHISGFNYTIKKWALDGGGAPTVLLSESPSIAGTNDAANGNPHKGLAEYIIAAGEIISIKITDAVDDLGNPLSNAPFETEKYTIEPHPGTSSSTTPPPASTPFSVTITRPKDGYGNEITEITEGQEKFWKVTKTGGTGTEDIWYKIVGDSTGGNTPTVPDDFQNPQGELHGTQFIPRAQTTDGTEPDKYFKIEIYGDSAYTDLLVTSDVMKLIDDGTGGGTPPASSGSYDYSYYGHPSSWTKIGCVSLAVNQVKGTVNSGTTNPIPAGNYASGDIEIFVDADKAKFESIFESSNPSGAIPDPVWMLDVNPGYTNKTANFWNWYDNGSGDGGFFPTTMQGNMSGYALGARIPGAKPEAITWSWDISGSFCGIQLKGNIQLDEPLPYDGWNLEMCLLKFNAYSGPPYGGGSSTPPSGGTPAGSPSSSCTEISGSLGPWTDSNANYLYISASWSVQDWSDYYSTNIWAAVVYIDAAPETVRVHDSSLGALAIDGTPVASKRFATQAEAEAFTIFDSTTPNKEDWKIARISPNDTIERGPTEVAPHSSSNKIKRLWSICLYDSSSSGGPVTPSGTPSTPSTPSSTQSPAPPVSPVGPITQPSPASYPTSGGSILLLHSDQNPPTCTTPTPADFFNNGLAATGTSRINHTFTSDMLSSVVLTNNAYNTIFYYLMDAAQNIEYLGSVTFYVDRDKPTGGITDPKGANWLPPYTAEWLGKNKPAPFDGSINVCDEPSTGGGTNTNILYPPPAPVPTYAISATTNHPNPLHNNLIHEGSLVATFTITTTDVPDGTVLYWTSDTPSYAPVTANDFTDNTLQGSVTIIGNSAVITRQALADNLTEGPETFRLQLRTDSVTGYIVATSNYIGISDTSITILPPPPTYAISVTTDKPGYNKSLSEGSYKATFVVTTTDVPDGTVLYWKTYTSSAGLTNAQDFADNATQGTLTINGNTGTIIREAVADSITEGPESFRIDIHIDSFNGLIVAQSDWIGIEDTSQAPPPPPPPTYNIVGTTTHATYKNTVVDEASEASVTYNVTTTNVPDGTILYWTHEPRLTAPQPSDFKDGMDRGSVTISGNSGIITRQIFADNTLEGPEVLRLELRTVSVTGSIVARSNFIAISDTSS